MTTQKRVFASEFKRETVALLESSGRPLAHIAAAVGIMPSMLRAWRRSIRSGPLSQAVTAGVIAPLPSPADQASQITKLRALAGRRFKPCTTDSRHDLAIAPNLLEQEFVATAPNQVERSS